MGFGSAARFHSCYIIRYPPNRLPGHLVANGRTGCDVDVESVGAQSVGVEIRSIFVCSQGQWLKGPVFSLSADVHKLKVNLSIIPPEFYAYDIK